MIDNYIHVFHHLDDRNTLSHLTLHILYYCEDKTRYIAARTLVQLILQEQMSLGRAESFSLVIKLGRKYRNGT